MMVDHVPLEAQKDIRGVLPNNDYTPMHYKILLDTRTQMNTWDTPVFDWLPALDDGNVHFKETLYHDGWHPNDAGYKAM